MNVKQVYMDPNHVIISDEFDRAVQEPDFEYEDDHEEENQLMNELPDLPLDPLPPITCEDGVCALPQPKHKQYLNKVSSMSSELLKNHRMVILAAILFLILNIPQFLVLLEFAFTKYNIVASSYAGVMIRTLIFGVIFTILSKTLKG